MSLNKLLLDTLKPAGVPVDFQVYTGTSSTYITFFLVVGVPKLHAENKVDQIEKLIQIDIWSKSDYTDLVESVKGLLEEAGFLYSAEREFYEKDTQIYHYVLSYKYGQIVS